MKYILSFTLLLFAHLNSFAQDSLFGFRVDFQTSLITEYPAPIPGIGLGLRIGPHWLLQFETEEMETSVRNIPTDYIGKSLQEKIDFKSFSLGRIIHLNHAKTVRLIAKIGTHRGEHKGSFQFTPKPPPSGDQGQSNLITELIDLITISDSHYVSSTKTDFQGLNAEVLVEKNIEKRWVIGGGIKYYGSKHFHPVGISVKLGYHW